MAAKRGRPPGSGKHVQLTDAHRDKIKNSNILSYLLRHIEGKRDMSPTQVQAALALLKKTLPDLSSVEHKGSDTDPVNIAHTIRLIAGGRDKD